jgi:hypothetical protein
MSKITISDLHTADSESFLIDVRNVDYMSVYGGDKDALHQILNYGVKSLNFALLAFAAYEVTELVKSFNTQY